MAPRGPPRPIGSGPPPPPAPIGLPAAGSRARSAPPRSSGPAAAAAAARQERGALEFTVGIHSAGPSSTAPPWSSGLQQLGQIDVNMGAN
ncbi:atherin-like isoform X2 [Aquila chrysaetos chrysaetos]|uniref:atherin-like isoform X2 n=1 Tax=Aquila chrysaetos chrysaetos TaxID=223781 RepID=UPI001B7D4485|nr:atherin-like isoform X2 [Aquila chrysaetos chrysaetos]